MHKVAKILFFCMIFVVKIVSGQKSDIKYSPKTIVYSPDPNFTRSLKLSPNKDFIKLFHQPGKPFQINRPPDLLMSFTQCAVVSADFYSRNFGFFCKKELEFEKKTKIPLRLRLGSIQYTDYLEGKPNSGILPNY